MADSPGFRKRARESDASQSSHSDDGSEAFDEGLSGEFEGKSHSTGSSLDNFSEGGAAETSDSESERERPRGPTEHNPRVYGYDEHGERLPSERGPRPPRTQATRAEHGPQAQRWGHGDPTEGSQEFTDGGEADGNFPWEGCGWDEDLDGEFEADLYDDEETADEAKQNPSWARRTERELKEWKEKRHLFAAALLRRQAAGPMTADELCSTPGCKGHQAVRCSKCAGGHPVCGDCDERLHPYAHFHERAYLMPEGRFWQAVGPDFGVRNGKLEKHPKVFAKAPSASCVGCGKCSWSAPRATTKPLTVVTLAGRFDFVRAVFPCGTAGCRGTHEQGSLDAVDLGAWPGTVSKCRTMYDAALMDFWDKMSKDQPGASMTALVKVLEGISRDRGRVGSINRHTMTTAFGEFKMARHSAKYPAALQSGLVCPACWAKQHSCAVDSNRKLYRWARVYDSSRTSYYENLFFFPDKDVQESIKAVDSARGVDRDRPDTACGTGDWKAARDSKSAIRGQDETGCTVCGCRHVFAQRAVNLVQMGERYANAYYLDRHFVQPGGVEFQWQDIVCKYWVWRKKTLEAMDHGSGGGLKPALNLMHGKLHSWQCQVRCFSVVSGKTAGGAGEDMELLFAYLSRLGVVTKVMGPARRVDVITEAVLHWNEGKARDLARSLVDRYSECRRRAVSAVAAFEAACEETLGVPSADVPVEKLRGWTDEIRKVADAQLRSSRRPRGSPAVEYFLLKREVESADSLSSYVNLQAFRDSPLCSESLQNLGGVSEELVKGRKAKIKKLRDLEKELFPELQGQPVGDEELQVLEARSRVALAEETIQSLQEEMESLLHSLEKLCLRVTNEADSSTMQSALRKKEAAVKKQLSKVVDRYNAVYPKVRVEEDPDWQPAILEDLLSGSELPWQFDRCLDDELEVSPGVNRTLHFKQKYELVEAFNKVKRLEEEDELLVREQKSYLSFYRACREDLEARIKSWREHLIEMLEKSEGSAVNTDLEITQRYSLADFDIASEIDLIRGTIARLWESHDGVGVQLRKGSLHFQHDAGGLERPWPKRLSERSQLWSEEDGQSTDPFVELDGDEED